MKIKKTLLCLTLLVSYNLQASFLSWLWPKQWNTKQSIFTWTFWKPKPSLDQMTEETIHNYEKSKFTSQYINTPKKRILHDIRQAKSQEAFIDTLIQSTIELQNKPKLQGKNKKIIDQAVKEANKAHYQTFTAVDKTQYVARAAAQKAYEITAKKEADKTKAVYLLSKAIIIEVYKQRQKKAQEESIAVTMPKECKSITTQTALNVYNVTIKNEAPGYTVFPNLQTRLQDKIPFNQSNPKLIGGNKKVLTKQELLTARLAHFEKRRN